MATSKEEILKTSRVLIQQNGWEAVNIRAVAAAYGGEQYPGFFTHHALGFVRQDTADGKQQMRQTWQHILDALTMVLTRDKKIRPDAFTEEFTRQKFAGILFSLMLSAVVQQDFDPTAVLEIIRRTIYEV